MDRFLNAKRLAAIVFGLGALVAASAAQARTDVYLSIGVPVAPVYAHPAPVYVQPRPVYVQPAPVYMHSRPMHMHAQPIHAPRHGHWNNRGGHGRDARGFGPRGDLDGDGVRNARDRLPHNPYRY